MCAPMLGAVVGLAGAAVSAMGAQQQAEAQAQQDEYNATVAKINARSERFRGYQEQERVADKADRLRGESIVAASKGGVDLYGSTVQVIFQEGRQAEFADKSNVYLRAESGAIGEENKAKSYEASAANHRQAGKIAAVSSLLGGLGGVAKGFSGASNPFLINA